MVDCDYCDEEFDSKKELHLHWDEEHKDELNSHEKDKVKKAKRKKEEEKDNKMRKRKQYAGYGLGLALALALIGIVGAQLMQSTGGGELGELGDQPVIGAENSSVTVVEFGDYACPHCRDFEFNTFSKLKENYIDNDKINFKFVNYAFLGEDSTKAAVASECVYRQDEEQFWDYHKAIFEEQGAPQWTSTDNLVSAAEDSTEGLNYDELRSCIDGRQTLDEVQRDKRLGSQAGVSGTPTVFLNGERVNNWEYSSLAQQIDNKLQE